MRYLASGSGWTALRVAAAIALGAAAQTQEWTEAEACDDTRDQREVVVLDSVESVRELCASTEHPAGWSAIRHTRYRIDVRAPNNRPVQYERKACSLSFDGTGVFASFRGAVRLVLSRWRGASFCLDDATADQVATAAQRNELALWVEFTMSEPTPWQGALCQDEGRVLIVHGQPFALFLTRRDSGSVVAKTTIDPWFTTSFSSHGQIDIVTRLAAETIDAGIPPREMGGVFSRIWPRVNFEKCVAEDVGPIRIRGDVYAIVNIDTDGRVQDASTEYASHRLPESVVQCALEQSRRLVFPKPSKPGRARVFVRYNLDARE